MADVGLKLVDGRVRMLSSGVLESATS